MARARNLEGLPPVRQERSVDFFRRLSAESGDFRTWDGELYLERHQGTYTTQARNKRFNRKLELALRELEWIGVMAAGLADHAYPVGDLELIWKEILLFQFHDILTGTSITRVFEESTARYEALTDEVERLTSSASQRLSAIVDLSSASDPALVFNSLPWPRSEWMSVKGSWHLVRDSPAMGYAVVDLASESAIPSDLVAREQVLENDKLRVVFAEDGAIVSVLDKDYRREVIAEAANRLVIYHDEGDAWDFAPDYRYGPVQRCPLQSAERLVDGPRAIIRHQYRMGTSTIDQDIVLTSGSRRLEFHTRVDWQEDHTMLRTSFPVLVRASEATCDIQFGSVKRPTHRNTGWDMARDEVCAHKWVDLSQGDYGVALLNDSKYGHCIRDNVIDLNLLAGRPRPTSRPTGDFTNSPMCCFPTRAITWRGWMSDIMEHTVDEIPDSEACLDVSLAPFEILTLKLSIGAPPR